MAVKIILSICLCVVLLGSLAGVKVLQFKQMGEEMKNFVPPPLAVSSFVAETRTWENYLPAVASLEAVQGVMIRAEVPGRVEKIAFTPGQEVQEGDLLIEMDISAEVAEKNALQANLDLAQLDLNRSRDLLESKTISQAEFDRAEATFKQQAAQLATVEAQIAKKQIVAPFSGKLGIRLVNLGEILNAGAPIVSLQNQKDLYVNFSLPQRIGQGLEPGVSVRVIEPTSRMSTMATLTTVNPQVNSVNRNVELQATFRNEEGSWLPGMYVEVQAILPEQTEHVVVPSTAITYASYGQSIFLIEKNEQGQKVAVQKFVRTGMTKGDFVSVTKGLEPGQEVVINGAFKLSNNAFIVVNNEDVPVYSETPAVRDE